MTGQVEKDETLSENAPSKFSRVRGRLLLLLPLAALMVAGGYLITGAPANSGKGTMGSWLSGDHRLAIFYDEVYFEDPNRTEIEITTIDLDSGEAGSIEVPSGNLLAAAADKQWNLYLLQHPLDETHAKVKRDSIRLVAIDSSTHEVRVTPNVAYPPTTFFRLVGERYLVGLHEHRIHVLDTKNIDKGATSIAAGPASQYVFVVKGANRFFLGQESPPPGQAKPNGPVTPTLNLFEIDDEGRPRVITNWPAGIANGWTSAEHNDRHIFSLSADLNSIEVHSLVDGKLTSSFPLPSVDDPNTGKYRFVLETLVVEKSNDDYHYFDLARREWLPQPEGKYRLYDVSPDRRYYYYRQTNGVDRFKVYDLLNDSFVNEFTVTRRAQVHRLDENRFLATSDRYGYSVRSIDAASGKTIRAIKPLAWVVHLLIAVLVLYAFWCVAWMLVSAREGGWGWTDVMLVVGLPTLMLLLRFMLRGDTLDLDRIPTRQALGGVMAGMMLAMTWIVFGKTRLSLRIVPLLVLVALFMVLLTFVFGEATWIVWYATTCAVVPAICLMLLLGVLRAAGWRLQQDAGDSSARTVDRSFGRSKFPLRDLVLMTVVSAMLFAAMRPVSDAVSQVYYMHTHSFLFASLALAMVLGVAAILLALHRRRWFFLVGVACAIAGVSFLAWEPLSAFIQGRYSTRWIDVHRLHAAIVCGVALFVGLIPYRLRGWSLSRRSAEPVPLP